VQGFSNDVKLKFFWKNFFGRFGSVKAEIQV